MSCLQRCILCLLRHSHPLSALTSVLSVVSVCSNGFLILPLVLSFLGLAMTNHHKLGGLNQQKFILTVKNKTRSVPDYTLTQSVGFQLHSMMYSIFSTCYNEAGNRLNGVFIRGQPNLISIKYVFPTRAPFVVWHKFQQMVCTPSSGHENSYLWVAFLNGNSISQIMLTHT